MQSRRRTIRLTIACLTTFLLVCPLQAQDAAYTVTVTTAQKAAFDDELTAFAQVEADPKKISTVVAPVNGTVQSINVLTGDSVSIGGVVAEIATDPVLLAQTKAAQATLRYMEEALAHQERLLEQQLATKDQVAAARREVTTAEANLAAAKRLGSDKSTVEVTAPTGGVVSSVTAVPGQQVLQGTAIATITNPEALLIRPGVEPADSRWLKPGDPTAVVAVTSPSDASGEPVTLSVMTVGSTVDAQTRLVPITILIDGPEAAKFIVGQTVRVTFSAGKMDMVTVPRTALAYEGTNAILFIVERGKAVKRQVKLAGARDGKIFVADGLRVGEIVITGGLSGLSDGARVTVTAP